MEAAVQSAGSEGAQNSENVAQGQKNVGNISEV